VILAAACLRSNTQAKKRRQFMVQFNPIAIILNYSKHPLFSQMILAAYDEDLV